MNNVLVAFCASAFVLGYAPALAQGMSGDNDMNAPRKIEALDAKTAAAAAKAKWASMTPEQQAGAEKAARAKKQAELTAEMEPVMPSGTSILTTPRGTPMIGDFFVDARTPEQREADARKAAADSEAKHKKQAERKKMEGQ